MFEFEDLHIERAHLSEQIAEQLQSRIVDGDLQPGDKLPSERDLAHGLGVSRGVVREATKILQQRGLVEARTGSGTYVADVNPGVLSEPFSLLIQRRSCSFEHLNEVRAILETGIAGLAAERSSHEDIAKMEKAIEAMRNAVALPPEDPDRLDAFAEADLAFHDALGEAARNPLLPTVLDPISEQLLDLRRVASSVPGAMESAVDYHSDILDAVSARDAARCRSLMEEHLRTANEWLARARERR